MDSQGCLEPEIKQHLTVKFTGRNIPIEISSVSTVKALKCLLHPLTDVLPRGQKLIFKGKVLSDELTMASLGITDGAKIMLLASQGLHQGEGPIKQGKRLTAEGKPTMMNTGVKKEKTADYAAKKRWEATGIIVLSDSHLKSVPGEVWTCGDYARVLDLSQNMLQEVPAEISRLHSLKKLLLNSNQLSGETISWDGLASLKFLNVLSLSLNNVTAFPSAIGALISLKQLDVSSNKLTSIPSEIGCLADLEVLKAQRNRINYIPTSIGRCVSLVEVDFSFNLISELPETFCNLLHLKAIYITNNPLKSLPATLFKTCLQLTVLDLHNTEITADLLRQFEGWESFNERRRMKYQKQLDFRVTGSGEFDEGADKNW